MNERTRICPTCSRPLTAPTCPFCRTEVPAESAPPRSASQSRWLVVGIVLAALVAVTAAIAVPGFVQVKRASNDRNASTSLKTLSSAEADFRANDRDGNRIHDFWTADVAGLYCIHNPLEEKNGRSDPIALIELSIAAADSAPLTSPAGPYRATIGHYASNCGKSGYWFWAMESDASLNPPIPYRTDTHGESPVGSAHYHPSKFGFLAYPNSLWDGKSAFIINESNTVFRRSLTKDIRPSLGNPPGTMRDPDFISWLSMEQLKDLQGRPD